MFKFIVIGIASLLLVSSATIIAADEKPVKIKRELTCYPLDALIASLKNKYGEEPMVMGLVDRVKGIGTGLYINKETGTYTVIEFAKGAACILSTGENVSYRLPTHPGTSL